MVKQIFLLMTIFLFVSCDTKLEELSMDKIPYTGNELRIDGYYYSNPDSENHIGIAVFYRDGFCIHTWGSVPRGQDTMKYVENEILLNNALVAEMKKDPYHIGVFHIMNPDIEFEVWEHRSWTFTYFGKIVNDSTFVISKNKNNRSNETYTETLTYKFKQFSPKPDSINVYIK